MKEKLTNNGVLKLISVGLAIFLWLLVINEDNPIETKNLTIYNVEYLNEDVVLSSGQTYTVENLDSKGVDISVQVRRKDSGKVRATDFKAVVDLAQVGPYGYAEVKVEWLGSSQYELSEDDITWKTKSVKVTLEEIISRSYPVQVKITGEPADGYIIGDYTAAPKTVDIVAPYSVQEQIRSVGIEVSVEGMNGVVEGTAKLKLYDVTGAELNLNLSDFEAYEFSMSAREIGYEIPLLKTKEVILRTNGYTGTVADGYRYTGMEGTNQTAYIAGYKATLAEVDAIDIPAEVLNLDGATANVEIQIDLSLYVPEGVTVEGNKIVTITLLVEPLVKQTRELQPRQIRIEGMQEGWEYTIQNNVPVIIEGLQEDLNTLTIEMLDAWISAKDLKPGVNTVEVFVNVDSGFEVVQVGTATVLMEEILETEESTEETEEETTVEETTEGSTSEGETEETTAEATSEAVDADVNAGARGRAA